VLAVRWQIAQKLHAVTEPPLRPGGENPRYWDLIDLQLLQALTGENLEPVKDACQRPARPWPPIRFTALNRRRRNARIRGRGEIAQLVEHSTENRGVGGSSPPLAIVRLGSSASPGFRTATPAGTRLCRNYLMASWLSI
jgi:hypothetical protein